MSMMSLFVLMEDAGTAFFDDQEVSQFREYLLKGGFVFVSDHRGDARSLASRHEVRDPGSPHEIFLRLHRILSSTRY